MKNPANIVVVDRFAPLRVHLLALLAEPGDIWIPSCKRDGFRSNPEINSTPNSSNWLIG